MKTQIKNPDELIGKTIEGVSFLSDELVISFTDGTYLNVVPDIDSFDSIPLVVCDSKPDFSCKHVQAMVMTQEELDKFLKEKDEIEKKRFEAFQRRQYERLKQKFEGK